MEFKPHRELDKALADQALFSAWLQPGLPWAFGTGIEAGSLPCLAQAELNRCLTEDHPRTAPSPFFAASSSAWSATMLADLPGSRDRNLFQQNLELLQAGKAEVVVTGQQPGAMGGPLYTLFKIATTVALARLRTSSGRPTVPLFWSGDDDDDLVEALKPRTFDPINGTIFGNAASLSAYADGSHQRPSVGRLPASRWSYQESQWLNGDDLGAILPLLGADLAQIWAEACAEDWNWARLNRRFLLRVFRGTGLLVVSGNDPFLHQSAAPLYEVIQARRQELAQVARQRGEVILSQGYSLPINERSLHRHLFTAHGSGRRFLEEGQKVSDAGLLRPGVMLRSPVQDWLFNPAAVVVGPGELAYLRQLDPLYTELGVARGPLVPRLFGWLVPEGFDPDLLTGAPGSDGESDLTVDQLAETAAKVAEEEVRRILVENLGTPPERAAKLAAGRSRRWRRSLTAMFKGEEQRLIGSTMRSGPVWVFPGGGRQERTLSSLGAAALWGDPLITAMINGAQEHLQLGMNGAWQEFSVQVPYPNGEGI